MGMDDTTVKLRGAPVLDEPALSAHHKMIADKLAVSELMSMAVVALPPVVRVRPSMQSLLYVMTSYICLHTLCKCQAWCPPVLQQALCL